MRPLHENLAGRLLHKLADALHKHPRWFFYPQVLLFLACLVYTGSRLEFSTSRGDLVSANNQHQRNYLEFRREFALHDSLVAIVESSNRDKNREFVERLAARVQREPGLFTNTYYKGDLKLMGPKALLFLSEDALGELRHTLADYRPLIRTFSQADNLNSLFDLVNRQFRTIASQKRAELNADSLVQALPALQRVVDQAAESVRQPTILPAPGITALFGDNEAADGRGLYLTFSGGQIYLLTSQAMNTSLEPAAIKRLRELVRETQREIPGVNAGITGEPVLRNDEMQQARRDTDVAAGISLVLSALIFIYGYREFRRPLLAVICLIIGIGYTLGFATLTVGRLNILSLTLVPILIGLAIDFAVHLITRYEEELRRGNACLPAIRKALVFAGLGIFTSGLTTAGAFFAMMLTDFKGIREMGLISGVGLLVCLIPMMTLLPLFLVRSNHREAEKTAPRPHGRTRGYLDRISLQNPKAVLVFGLFFTVFAITQWPRVRYDYNLLNLQTRDLPAVGMEQKLVQSGSQSLLYCAVVADSLEHAVELEERITRLPAVANVVSLGKYLSEDQTRKLALVREIKTELAAITFAPDDTEPVEPRRLGQTLGSLESFCGLAAGKLAADKADPTLVARLRALRDSVDTLRMMIAQDDARAVPRLTGFQQSLFRDLHETVDTIRAQDDRERLTVADLPPFLRDRFIGVTGRYLLQIYPKEDVWQRHPQERFIRQLRTVDPNVTGSPVQHYEYTSMLRDTLQHAALYAGVIIALMVWLHFRRISSVLLAFLPVALGFGWMLGLMGLFDIPFNPLNIMSLTLVIGIGVTNGIHILNRFAEEAHPSVLARSTGKAVIVSAMTAMAGFGSLMVAQHQGIASFGKVMLIGTAMCMLASLAFLPAVLNLLNRAGWTMTRKRGK